MSANIEPDNAEEDLLEKMLKEAEMLAAKMTVTSKKDESFVKAVVPSTNETRTSDDPSSDPMDPLLDKAEKMVQAFREAADGGSGSIHTSTDTVSLLLQRLDEPPKHMEGEEPRKGGRDEMLQQSKNLIQKMPSGSIDSPTGSLTKEGAPTSVYVLHHNNGADDFSSVGSSSLKAPSISGDNRAAFDDAINASLSMADAIREIQSAGSRSPTNFPATPTPSAPDDNDCDDEVSVKDYTSVSSSSELQKKMLVMAAKLEAGIPDFKAHSPDAKWEKVSSAERGDDDYASIQDFTKEKPRKSIQKRVEAPVKQSRLHAYRVQARRRRRRQRLILTVTIVVAVAYYLVFGVGFGSGKLKNASNDVAIPTALESNASELDAEMGSNMLDEVSQDQLEDLDLVVDDDEQSEVDDEDNDFKQVEFSDLKYWSEEDDTVCDEVDDGSGEDLSKAEDVKVEKDQDIATQLSVLRDNEFVVTIASGRRVSCQNPINRFFRKPCRVLFRERRLAMQMGIAVDHE